jgi:hypothetical protein
LNKLKHLTPITSAVSRDNTLIACHEAGLFVAVYRLKNDVVTPIKGVELRPIRSTLCGNTVSADHITKIFK